MLEIVRSPDLWEILETGEDSGHQTEASSPFVKRLGERGGEDGSDDDHDQSIYDGDQPNRHSRSPARRTSTKFIGRDCCSSVSEEDQE